MDTGKLGANITTFSSCYPDRFKAEPAIEAEKENLDANEFVAAKEQALQRMTTTLSRL